MQCSRTFFYSNFPRESNDSKLTFPDQRIKNSSLYLWINRCMIYWNQWHNCNTFFPQQILPIDRSRSMLVQMFWLFFRHHKFCLLSFCQFWLFFSSRTLWNLWSQIFLMTFFIGIQIFSLVSNIIFEPFQDRNKNKLELPFNMQNPDATLTISHKILQ
jgi:hypothetical protein